MPAELNTTLSELMVNENRRLSTENQDLLQLNEAHNVMAARVLELGGLDAIEEALKKVVASDQEVEILESFTRSIEEFGSLEVIQESLHQFSDFTEKHGPLSKVEEALVGSKTHLQDLADFVKENGSLQEVRESLKKVEDRLPRINEGLELARDAREFQEKFGTFEQIEEALTRSVAVLGVQARKAKAAKLSSICESLGLTTDKAHELMSKHKVDINGLRDLCESFGGIKAEDKGADINEAKVTKAPEKGVRGQHFLNMTRDRNVQGEGEDVNESKKVEDQKKRDPFRSKTRLERMVG